MAHPVKVVDGGAGGKVDDELCGSAVCCFRRQQSNELERLFSRMAGDVGVLQATEDSGLCTPTSPEKAHLTGVRLCFTSAASSPALPLTFVSTLTTTLVKFFNPALSNPVCPNNPPARSLNTSIIVALNNQFLRCLGNVFHIVCIARRWSGEERRESASSRMRRAKGARERCLRARAKAEVEVEEEVCREEER